MNEGEAEALAARGLVFLASDMEALGRFLALTGLDPAKIRKASREPGFLAAVLDHIMSDESLLLAFAANANLSPERVAQAHAVLSGAGRGAQEG